MILEVIGRIVSEEDNGVVRIELPTEEVMLESWIHLQQELLERIGLSGTDVDSIYECIREKIDIRTVLLNMREARNLMLFGSEGIGSKS